MWYILGSPKTNQLENFMKTSGKNKILFLNEDYADGQGTFTYPDGSKYVTNKESYEHV